MSDDEVISVRLSAGDLVRADRIARVLGRLIGPEAATRSAAIRVSLAAGVSAAETLERQLHHEANAPKVEP